MSDTRTPDQIEREIERERARLGRTVDELQDRISPERLLRELGRGLSDHGQDIGSAITQSVKRNPVALALTGVGLAWLMSGRSWDEDKRAVASASFGRDSDSGSGTSAPGASRAPVDPLPSRRAPVAADPLAYRAPDASGATLADRAGDGVLSDGRTERFPDDDDWLYADDDPFGDDADEDAGADDAGFGDRLAAAGSSIGDAARDHAQAIGDKGRETADGISAKAGDARDRAGETLKDAGERIKDGAANTRDRLRAAQDSTAAKARRIRRRLARGTEELAEDARERVIAARWAAVKARRETMRRARIGTDKAQRFYDENPLVVGGLALAAGAILAGALPRTRQEDELLGEQSDRYAERARRTFENERQKAMKVADRAMSTAREVLEEERAEIDGKAPGHKSAAEHAAATAKDKAKDGASRVVEAARDEAKKQKLGEPS
ncbi:DUF3618 domain-containing protein [Poseidonocella sedimentorum]|uniref:DUF3618 domain-containing protein n=1 Tax=Poseidonocella sedimentorum TaxID=871652 RepID=A0A1I6E1J3_9RHOB|nr:DUF3618 domain-containing protein [Poseidonocella sedimentorum]SFR11421.1 Protein of unknown function [Poseidonocella sedimentorum]